MEDISLELHKWVGYLPHSIKILYNGEFKNNDISFPLVKTLNGLLVVNFNLWQYEDNARRADLPDKGIAELKRNIDRENQARHDSIDYIDAFIQVDIEGRLGSINKSLPLNSETPGSIYDRLIVIALRVYNLKKEIEREDVDNGHIKRCCNMLIEVEERFRDILKCLEELLADYYSGKKRLKAYKQHKLYNDPSLNPSLRK